MTRTDKPLDLEKIKEKVFYEYSCGVPEEAIEEFELEPEQVKTIIGMTIKEIEQRIKSAVQGLKKDIVEMQFEQDEDGNIYISFTKGKIIELIKKWFPNMIENE